MLYFKLGSNLVLSNYKAQTIKFLIHYLAIITRGKEKGKGKKRGLGKTVSTSTAEVLQTE